MTKRQLNPLTLIFVSFFLLYVAVGFVLRAVLTIQVCSTDPIGWLNALRVMGVGTLGDCGMAIMLSTPLLVLALGMGKWKYHRNISIAIASLLWLALGYVSMFHTALNEYGGGAPLIARILLGWKALSFTLRAALPSWRDNWRKVTMFVTWGVYVFLTLFLAVGEYVFWDEFAARFNFIAVDYLIYTNEVVGNIVESYNMVPIVAIPLAITVLYIWMWQRRYSFVTSGFSADGIKVRDIIILVVCGYGVAGMQADLTSDNSHVEQLEQNGAYDFVRAFFNNTIDYEKYYPLLREDECRRVWSETVVPAQTADTVAATRPNIILITVESLSANFLKRFGNDRHLTPTLDSLARAGMSFDNLYANGNRTVRGLEALSLCLPPAAGESVIKRPDNDMHGKSVGAMLDSIGYEAMFVYGGDSYFDNMGSFFANNGYKVVDRKDIPADSIRFANIWGVCDEDLFNHTLRLMDARSEGSAPVFAHLMTTSNHRPYTYPEGRVPGSPKTRDGAVAYTDVAIGEFMRRAATRPWFGNTIFVIVADHCASSAGKTELPIDGYHIPSIVYAPGRIDPRTVNTLCSQIDILPTLFAMVGLPQPPGAGANIFSPAYSPRSFMATYQDLGYRTADRLTVLSPVRRVRQYAIDATGAETLLATPDTPADVRAATAIYQLTNTK